MPIILATWEAEIGKILNQGHLGKQFRRHHNQSKIDWRCGLSGRAPALQVQKP
jgi:hypothetical protein